MLNRRSFLKGTLAGASLLSMGTVVPEFVAQTARAAEEKENKAAKENVLVIIELTGGNDGLNTVIPHADDLYHKARPTLRYTKQQVVAVTDDVGLHPSFGNWRKMIGDKHVAVVQGVGYPNPDRSHFESMDVWQSGDPKRRITTGWAGRSAGAGLSKSGEVPLMHLGSNRLPLALQGSSGGAVSVNDKRDYRLHLGTNEPVERKSRGKLLTELSEPDQGADPNSMLAFVQKRQLQTYTSLDKLQEILSKRPEGVGFGQPVNSLLSKLQLIAGLISTGFGTRVYYVALDGFDTHSSQSQQHARLLQELADAVFNMYSTLQQRGEDKRVVTMTFSEFGRRVVENGSKGTDHGSGSSQFVLGPAVQGGLVGKHPSLKDLDDGDLKYHTDFRRVYATILDRWLGVKSKDVLNGTFEPLDFLKA